MSISDIPQKTMSIREQARMEVNEERKKEALGKMKSKLRELNKAKKVVANIEREIEDLELDLSLGID